MTHGRAWSRALRYAAAIPLLVLGGAAAAARVPAESAGALALDAIVVAGTLSLLALAGASLVGERASAVLGLGPGRLRGRAVALGALGLVGLSHAFETALQLAGIDAGPTIARFERALSGLGPSALALPLVAFAGASALGEELFFRGLLQRGLARVVGAAPAVATAALAFGVAHVDPTHGSAALVLGLYLGTLAHFAGSIRISIAAHALNNATAVLEVASGFELPQSGPAAWIALAAGLSLAGAGLAAVARVPEPPADASA
jgi:membrane protease YdiL (CAAX protease family)